MEIKRIGLVYFSPLKNTRKIIYNIGYTLSRGIANHQANLTGLVERERTLNYEPDDLLVAALPSYGGRIPPVVPALLRNCHGQGTPAVAVVTYGGRGYDDQLAEMQAVLTEQGFVVVAGAAFVCQHAMSPLVGVGRPDADDLSLAREFGTRVREKLEADGTPRALQLPGSVPTGPATTPPTCPTTLEDCVLCMQCYRWCPMDAIPWNDPMHTEADRCVMCQGCVRRCPVNARRVLDEGFKAKVKAMEESLAGQHATSEIFV